MVNSQDISRTFVVCDRINLSIKRENITQGETNVEFGLGIKWHITEVKAENRGLKCKVYYTVSGNIFDGAAEATVFVDFARSLTQEETVSLDTSKMCAVRSAEYLVEWVAYLSSKMGSSPFIIPLQTIRDLIHNAK